MKTYQWEAEEVLSITLNLYQGLAVAALVYTLGCFMVRKIHFLAKYCIPAPVVGGLVYAGIHLLLRNSGLVEISFSSTLQELFMTLFFTSVGYTASFRMLKKGGVQVALLLSLAVGLLILQDLLGVGLASVFGLEPALGLCVGSIPLVGGHATAGSFGASMDAMGITGASTVAIAAATFGLVAGSMLGGPIARRRIVQLGLCPGRETGGGTIPETSDLDAKTQTGSPGHRYTMAAVFLAAAAGLGTFVSDFLGQFMTFPSYIGAMVAAVVIRNVWDAGKWQLPEEEMDVTGNVCLSLFLSFALMGLKLWQLADLALPMLVMLAAQTVMMTVVAYFAAFYVMGRDYEAAVMSSALCGFGMGATSNAMANMQAITGRYGPAPRAFFVVPLVGSLFVDFFNAAIITVFLNIFA